MAIEALSQIPSSFRAGDTLRVETGFNDYPATAWTAALNLRSVDNSLTVTGTASGDDFIFVITAAQSRSLTPGRYGWSIVATEIASSEVQTADYGETQLLPDLSQSAKGPRRLAYEAARTAMESLAGKKFSSVSVDGQSYTLRDMASLIGLVDRMHADAIAEDNARGIPTAGGLKRIRMVF